MDANNYPQEFLSHEPQPTQTLEDVLREFMKTTEQYIQNLSPSQNIKPNIGNTESIPNNEEDEAIQVPPSSDLMTRLLKEIDFDDPNVIINYGESTISFGCFELNDEEISMTVDEPEESIKFESGSGVAYNEGLVNGYEPMVSFSQGHNDYESLEDMHAREMAEVDIFESLHQLAMFNFNVENETPMSENSDSLDECLAHFENSNDPIIQEIVKALHTSDLVPHTSYGEPSLEEFHSMEGESLTIETEFLHSLKQDHDPSSDYLDFLEECLAQSYDLDDEMIKELDILLDMVSVPEEHHSTDLHSLPLFVEASYNS